MTDLDSLKIDLRKFQRPSKARVLMRFFKTGKGEYGERDEFLGLVTAETRSVARKYFDLSFVCLAKLLASRIHEERSVAVQILTRRFAKEDLGGKKEIYDFYFANIAGINNWDLVDNSAPRIAGGYLYLSGESRKILYELAESNDLWKKRVGMMATYFFIKQKDFSDALQIAEILVNDSHDLIHKAVGWMLREIGNRDIRTEEEFLKKYYQTMPRTMLRYAIEKFPEEKRKKYLKGRI